MMLFKKKENGLTLIEVLIAVAIVGIALTAVIKATSQNIRATTYLQNKTIAMWVGKEVMNEARVGILKLPDPGNTLKKKKLMLGRDWYWHVSIETTPNQLINKINVLVYEHENEDEVGTPLISLESYIYHAK